LDRIPNASGSVWRQQGRSFLRRGSAAAPADSLIRWTDRPTTITASKSRARQRPSGSLGGGIRPPASEREISVDRVSHKDGDTKHAQDYRDDFNHFDAPLLLVRLIADPVFMPASSGPENDHRSSYGGLSARWWAVRGSKPEAEPAAAGDTSPAAKPLVFHDRACA
jgi:hypothetical protein